MSGKIIKFGVVLIGLCILVSIGMAVYLFNKPKRDIAKIKVEYILSASQLLSDFTKNENAANAKYLSAAYGKVIQVSGVIAEIVQKGDTVLNISLKDQNNKIGTVNCSMQRTQIPNAKFLKVGNQTAIKGECAGYINIVNEVSLVNCILNP